MKITMSDLPIVELQAFYGGEGSLCAHMFQDANNKIMKGELAPGASIGMHTHASNSEIIFILEGEGVVLFDDKKEAIHAGDCHYCPKGHAHSLMNQSQTALRFYAVVPEHE